MRRDEKAWRVGKMGVTWEQLGGASSDVYYLFPCHIGNNDNFATHASIAFAIISPFLFGSFFFHFHSRLLPFFLILHLSSFI